MNLSSYLILYVDISLETEWHTVVEETSNFAEQPILIASESIVPSRRIMSIVMTTNYRVTR